MKVEQLQWIEGTGWKIQRGELSGPANLVLVFGDSRLISRPEPFQELKALYKESIILGCSTAGNILGTEVLDDCVVATAIQLEKGQVRFSGTTVESVDKSFEAGERLIQDLNNDSLRHLLVISEGLDINGSELVRGINSVSNNRIPVTGGLAGDGSDFNKTWVLANGPAQPDQAAAIGFYGESLNITTGCVHGWEKFGVDRVVTRSEKNVVFEIDGEPALDLYKRYLGPELARELPASGLRFPLSMRSNEGLEPVVRTLLGVDEEQNSLTFAGEIPEGKVVVLMKSNLEGLVKAAQQAAEEARPQTPGRTGVAVAISCVGRRLVLSRQTEEEVEAVQETLGDDFYLTGYYSYGELAPFADYIKCQLHNQTMTLTTISE